MCFGRKLGRNKGKQTTHKKGTGKGNLGAKRGAKRNASQGKGATWSVEIGPVQGFPKEKIGGV